MVVLKTIDRALCQSWHYKANALLKSTWGPPTDNYAGEPLYNQNSEIVAVRPLFDGEQYVFPLMDNAELFLSNGVITQDDLTQYSHDNTQ